MGALDQPDLAKAYPPSTGDPALRDAVVGWFDRRLGVSLGRDEVGLCVGTKELVAGVPHWLRLRDPSRDTVLYPEVSYPTYEMGARLAGCNAFAVPLASSGALDLERVPEEVASRALCLWSNSPSNPTGELDDLPAVAAWGRDHGVPVFSDECYLEFTWEGTPSVPSRRPGATILSSGVDGVVAVNSLSKRSNLAGLRVGFFAGDPELVGYLNEIRKHSGLMVPGPVQSAARLALEDQDHVEEQRERYLERLDFLIGILGELGLSAEMPRGGFYLWVDSGGEGGWELTERIATGLGVIVSPGEFYGPGVGDHVRVAAVQPLEVLRRIADRL